MAFARVTTEELLEMERARNMELASKLQQTENALLELAQIVEEMNGTTVRTEDN